MMKTYQYRPQGVCSNLMEVSVEDGVIRDVKIAGGCSGNSQGSPALVRGMKVEDAVSPDGGDQMRHEGHVLPGPTGQSPEAGVVIRAEMIGNERCVPKDTPLFLQ